MMTPEQARGGHCTRGGSIASGAAVCECGGWRASDHEPGMRGPTRRSHLRAVRILRRLTADTSDKRATT